MKKITATILISTLALLPASSAWAGGGAPASTKDLPSDSTSSFTRETGDSSAERVFAVGCWRGHSFYVDVDHNGNFSGHLTSHLCDTGDSFTFL